MSSKSRIADTPTSLPQQSPVGLHLLAELADIDPTLLQNEQKLMQVLEGALLDAGCHILHRVSHHFPGHPSGVTGLIMLSESHATFHTYPELRYMALDLFVCGDVAPEDVYHRVCSDLQVDCGSFQIVRRGPNETAHPA